MNDPTWFADAPLFSAWRRVVHADVAPFTVPGHKRLGHVLHPDLGLLLDADVPLYGGADTVKLTAGVLTDAERRAAEYWGADACRFSTGGSTHANQVLCLAVGRPGATVLVARNSHRSVLGGLVLAGLVPVWLDVEVDDRTGAPIGPSADSVRAALAEHPGVAAVFVTSPSYLGCVPDLAGIVRAAHAHDVPVVVDQAWAAHFGTTDAVPPHALTLGADAVVTSAHKMLPSYSQASVVLVRSARIDPDRFERAFEATHTTSPSATILASIDAARALLASDDGRAAVERLVALAERARERLRALGLVAPGPADHPPGRFDPAKLVMHLGPSGRSGLDVERELSERGTPVEMADRDTLVAQLGLFDDDRTVDRLLAGVEVSLAGPAGPPRLPAHLPAPRPPMRLTPREAFFARAETVDRGRSTGRVSAELIAPYPPGVPLVVPGEEITAATWDALDAAVATGTRIAYAADPTLRTLQVVVTAPDGP